MATGNPFDLLVDDDTEDLSLLISVQKQKTETKKASPPSAKPAVEVAAAKLPSKPLPPAQAVREAKTESSRGGRGGGRGYGRGRGRVVGSEFHKEITEDNAYRNREMSGSGTVAEGSDSGKPFERRGGHGGPRGPYRGVISNGDRREGERERPRRTFDRHSGTGHGNETKREGAGRGNWGTQTDQPTHVAEEEGNEGEKTLDAEKPLKEDPAVDGDKEVSTNEVIEKEPEDKEMTLDEYEKVLEEKRKGLQALKTEERKVDAKEFKAMQQLTNKKTNTDIFIKLGSEKDKKKESSEKEEKSKKSVSINEFLKPSEGERYHNSSGRNRGRGRGPRGGYIGGSDTASYMKAPAIEDPGQFPTLGGK